MHSSPVSADVANFFQPSIDCIVQAVVDQERSALKEVSVSQISSRGCTPFKAWLEHVVLVGGFAASDYLFQRVEAQLTRKGLMLVRPDNRVWVTSYIPAVFSCKCMLTFTCAETKLRLTGPYPSSLITTFALELRRSLMELMSMFATTNLIRSTSKGLPRSTYTRMVYLS
jgi:hypothetical protein